MIPLPLYKIICLKVAKELFIYSYKSPQYVSQTNGGKNICYTLYFLGNVIEPFPKNAEKFRKFRKQAVDGF